MEVLAAKAKQPLLSSQYDFVRKCVFQIEIMMKYGKHKRDQMILALLAYS